MRLSTSIAFVTIFTVVTLVYAAPIPQPLQRRIDLAARADNITVSQLNIDPSQIDCKKMTRNSDKSFTVPLPDGVSSLSGINIAPGIDAWRKKCFIFQGAQNADTNSPDLGKLLQGGTPKAKPQSTGDAPVLGNGTTGPLLQVSCDVAQGPADDGTFTVPPASSPSDEGTSEAIFGTACIKFAGQ
ncbi:hypothetical protein K474DRAFT_325109 [Panus rudis PR-1116 ss-1]|nr:hypothetical protein K474DRAFT_325109 [Panus rudis PR-1116 ss-1]